MKIVVVLGSPHRNGSSNLIAEGFIEGAKEAGHSVEVFDVERSVIGYCTGCGACGTDGPCMQQDDMEKVCKPAILAADMVVFVSPIYYFGLSAQIKTVIDRFYSCNGRLQAKHLKAALITASWDDDDDVMPYVKDYYGKLCRYLNFEDQGMILGRGCGTVAKTKATSYPKKAYELGKSL